MEPGVTPSEQQVWWASTVGLALVIGVACRQEALQTGAAGEACIADSIGTLRLESRIPDCDSDGWRCRLNCKAGDPRSCVALAYALEQESRTPEAREFFQRACLLGAANACTNYAATIWSQPATDSQLMCARRTFEKACAAGEPFGCGMVGRLMLESDKNPSYRTGRAYLEQACNQIGGFSCRVLAKHLESGKLGDHPPNSVQDLLRRACATGDPDACGTHATAADTFE